MEASKIVALVLFVLSGSVLLLFAAIPVYVRVFDWLAMRAARRYCAENGLECIEAKAWPNHYGLHFRSDGRRFYASFDFERDRTITWKKGTPLEVARRVRDADPAESEG